MARGVNLEISILVAIRIICCIMYTLVRAVYLYPLRKIINLEINIIFTNHILDI